MIIVLLIAGMLFSAGASDARASEDIEFPFTGIISADNVNIRAGASTSFEILYQLNKTERVVVVGKAYRWYKIKLPRQAKSFISKDYVYPLRNTPEAAKNDKISNGVYREKVKAMVTGDDVNIRAGGGTNYSILGQLHTGDAVTILEEYEGWLRIEPPENFIGWIYADFVEYYSPQQLSREEIAAPQRAAAEEKPQKEVLKPEVKEPQETKNLPVAAAPSPVAVGVIEDLGVILNRPGRQKLRRDNGRIFYLKSESVDLAKYVYYRVRLWGSIEELPELKYPLITVEKVELVE